MLNFRRSILMTFFYHVVVHFYQLNLCWNSDIFAMLLRTDTGNWELLLVNCRYNLWLKLFRSHLNFFKTKVCKAILAFLRPSDRILMYLIGVTFSCKTFVTLNITISEKIVGWRLHCLKIVTCFGVLASSCVSGNVIFLSVGPWSLLLSFLSFTGVGRSWPWLCI